MVVNDREEDYTVPNKIRVIFDFEKVSLLFTAIIDSAVIIISTAVTAYPTTTTTTTTTIIKIKIK